MKIRQMAVALLYKNGKVLFVQRDEHRTLLPGYLVPVGGHIEPGELNEPAQACVREIYEETGIREEEIDGLRLKYIIYRMKDEEVRVQYMFVGDVLTDRKLVNSDDEELVWLSSNELQNKKVTYACYSAVRHFEELGIQDDEIYLGTMNRLDGELHMSWAMLQDG
ncbi:MULTISPECIES: NUDIX hydrolase [Allobacillus]|nr:NUDIX hydrolase [Allobacillus salarius]